MGWLGNLAANGCRNAMLSSYKKHVEMAKRNGSPMLAHHAGLYAALATRYTTRLQKVEQAQLAAELLPFLLIPDHEMAIKALAEYVLYEEAGMNAVDIYLLGNQINGGLKLIEREAEGVLAFGPDMDRSLASTDDFRRVWSGRGRIRFRRPIPTFVSQPSAMHKRPVRH